MFSKEYRLRDTKRIAEVFKVGKYIHGKYVFIKYTSNNKNCSRIAISVSTKLFKQAVKRNLLKRRIREAIKPYLSNIPPLDILIIAKKELTTDISGKRMATDISNIFNKLTSPKS